MFVDHFQHVQGRQGDDVAKAVVNADRAVGRIIEATERAGIKDSTAFLIVEDHGFINVHTHMAPNALLAKAGLMENKKDRGNWKAVFRQQGGTTFLYLKDKNDKKTLQQVQSILGAVPASQKKLFRVMEQAELSNKGANPEVRLALAAVPGVTFSDSAAKPTLKPTRGGTHGYFPDFEEMLTGFVASGAGLGEHKHVSRLGLEDIAPLVAHLLGLDMKLVDGTFYPGLVQPIKSKETKI